MAFDEGKNQSSPVLIPTATTQTQAFDDPHLRAPTNTVTTPSSSPSLSTPLTPQQPFPLVVRIVLASSILIPVLVAIIVGHMSRDDWTHASQRAKAVYDEQMVHIRDKILEPLFYPRLADHKPHVFYVGNQKDRKGIHFDVQPYQRSLWRYVNQNATERTSFDAGLQIIYPGNGIPAHNHPVEELVVIIRATNLTLRYCQCNRATLDATQGSSSSTSKSTTTMDDVMEDKSATCTMDGTTNSCEDRNEEQKLHLGQSWTSSSSSSSLSSSSSQPKSSPSASASRPTDHDDTDKVFSKYCKSGIKSLKTESLYPGAMVYLPPKVCHSFDNKGDEDVILAWIFTNSPTQSSVQFQGKYS